MGVLAHGLTETMSLRDVGKTGLTLVSVLAILAAVLLMGAWSGVLFQPTWILLFAGLAVGLPILALFTVWFLYEVAFGSEIRRRRARETREVAAMGTAEALLRLMDHADALLERLTKYTGWFFFLMLLAIFIGPVVVNFLLLGLSALGGPSALLSIVVGGINLAFWAAYFYYYYKIKHENDLWKERIAQLRQREKSLGVR